MDVAAIDHVNLAIPEERIDTATDFYEGVLGFETENLDAYRSGEKPIFTFRITDEHVIHVSPVADDEFESPSGENYGHTALRLDEDLDRVEATLDDAGCAYEEKGDLLGATGTAPALYVRDPFGYTFELKETPPTPDPTDLTE